MDDEKRTVLVAALSAYADSISQNRVQLDLEQGKGKGKASDDDMDLTAELQSHINLCGELVNCITDATPCKDIVRTSEPGETASKSLENELELYKDLEKIFGESPARSNSQVEDNWWADLSTTVPSHQTGTSFSRPQQSYIVDSEPYINPFTGLPVIPDTGYEAGPSNRAPAPLRESPRLPSLPLTLCTQPDAFDTSEADARVLRYPPLSPHPLSLSLEPSSKAALRFNPNLFDRRAPLQVPLEASSTTPSATLLAEIPASPLHSPRALKYQEPQQRLISSEAPRDYGFAHATSLRRKPVNTEHQADILPPKSYHPLSSIPFKYPNEQPTISLPSPSDWVADPQDNIEGGRYAVSYVSNTGPKSKYLRHIFGLASKVVKAAGSMVNVTRTPSAYQPQPLSPGEIIRKQTKPPAKLREEPPGDAFVARNAISHVSATPQRGRSQRMISRGSSPPECKQINTSQRASLASISSPIKSSISKTSPTISSRTSISSLRSPSTNSNFDSWDNSTSTRSSSIASPTISRPRLQKYSGQATVSPIVASLQSGITPLLPTSVTLGIEKSSTSTTTTTSPAPLSINCGHDLQTSCDWKQQSSTCPLPNPASSYNPWKDQMNVDETFARALQRQEYLDIQIERDRLLAYNIANGTAVDGDIEFAYFMSQETASLISLVDAVESGQQTLRTPEHTRFAPYDLDNETLRMQRDWTERKLEAELRAKDAADEANLAAAKRLQAEFDRELQNHEAWEDWKKSNIEECIICGDEQHREEFVRPCKHGYCESCLQDGFKAALNSKTPLKCCEKTLSIESCSGLSTEFVAAYKDMMLELATPNPMYCCNAKCARFLPPRVIVGDVGTCEECRTQTCRHCRRRTHPGTFCKEDKDTKAVKDLAKLKGWKNCPGCGHLIERYVGCLHMVCSRCQTAFCYRCSKRWKDCESTCPDPISATHPKV